MDLLSTGNPKTVKGEKSGYLTSILHLAPAKASGVMNTCAFATRGCTASCLAFAGRAEIDARIPAARVRKTRELKLDPRGFVDRLARDVERLVRKCERDGMTPAVRLNGTSDLPWHRLRGSDGLTLLERFPDVTFYDYTKDPRRPAETLPANYSVTFSFSGENLADALFTLETGGNVAVVFSTAKGREFPETWHGFRVIDGDESDLRFLDPRGVVVGLRLKGQGSRRQLKRDGVESFGGFVQAA